MTDIPAVVRTVTATVTDDVELNTLTFCVQILEDSLLNDEHKVRIAYYLLDRYKGKRTND